MIPIPRALEMASETHSGCDDTLMSSSSALWHGAPSRPIRALLIGAGRLVVMGSKTGLIGSRTNLWS